MARRKDLLSSAGAGALALACGAVVAILDPSANLLLVSLIALLLIGPLVATGLRDRLDPFDPRVIFALAYGAMFVVRPASALLDDRLFYTVWWGAIDARSAITKTLIAAAVGAAAFQAGYALSKGPLLAGRLPAPRDYSERAAIAASLALAAVGIVLYTLFLALSGIGADLSLLLAGRSERVSEAYVGTSDFLSSGLILLIPAGLMLWVLGRETQRGPVALLGALIIAAAALGFATAGGRIALLPLVGGLFVFHFVSRQRRPSIITLVAALALALFASAVLVQSRDAGDQSTLSTSVSRLIADPATVFDPLTRNPDTEMALVLATALDRRPSDRWPTLGAVTLVDLATRPIPRSVWSGKPLIPRVRLVRETWPETAKPGVSFNPAFSVLLFPYLEAGLVGVALFMLAFGMAARVLYAYLMAYRSAMEIQLLFSVLLVLMVSGLRDDPVDSLARLLMIAAPIMVIFRIASRGRESAPPTIRGSRGRELAVQEQVADTTRW